MLKEYISEREILEIVMDLIRIESHKNVSHNDDIEGAEYGTYLMKGNKLKMKFEGDDSGEDIAYVSFQKNKSIMVWRYEGDDEGDCVYLQRYTEE